jgi:hypothetical protein
MNIQKVKISLIKPNPSNPRVIKDDKFAKLVDSIKNFPKMLEIRPIVVNSEMIVLGGNMRFRACQEAGLTEVPIIQADELTEEEQKEFVIKDNVNFGEWDWAELANGWANSDLTEWGLSQQLEFADHFGEKDVDPENKYSRKVEAPIYEPKNEKPSVADLIDKTKTVALIERINASSVPEEEKEFLRLSAQRHLVFKYSLIADYYAHSEPETQSLMEDSALVIVDFDQAIEKGFVQLSKEIAETYASEYE